jgi:hypothetical protein
MTDLVRREAEFLLHQTEDGRTRVEVRFDSDTAWLSLRQMALGIKKHSGEAA